MECFVWGIQVIYFIAASCCLLWKGQERRVNLLPITIRQERGEQRRLVQKAGDVKGVCLRRHLREGRAVVQQERGEGSEQMRSARPSGAPDKGTSIKVDRKREWNKLKRGHEQHYVHFEDQVLHCEFEKGWCSRGETDVAAALREERPPQESPLSLQSCNVCSTASSNPDNRRLLQSMKSHGQSELWCIFRHWQECFLQCFHVNRHHTQILRQLVIILDFNKKC